MRCQTESRRQIAADLNKRQQLTFRRLLFRGGIQGVNWIGDAITVWFTYRNKFKLMNLRFFTTTNRQIEG